MDVLQKIEERLSIIEGRPTNSKEVWTLEDFSIYSGIKKSYLYKLVMQRKLPIYKPGGKLIFLNRDEAINWLLQNKVKTEAEHDTAAATYVTLKPLGLSKKRRA